MASPSPKPLKNLLDRPVSPSKTDLDAVLLRLVQMEMHRHPNLEIIGALKRVRRELETIGLTMVWEKLRAESVRS